MAPNNMTPGQSRVIDPILSTHARGYTNLEMIGHLLFPIVNIPTRGVRVLKFGKEAFRMLNTARAPGSQTARVQYGYASDPVALRQESLEGLVPWENQQEAANVPGIDLASGSIEMVLDVIALGREHAIAKLARNAANYGSNNKLALAGSDKWSEPTSDPAKDIKTAKEQTPALSDEQTSKLKAAVNKLKDSAFKQDGEIRSGALKGLNDQMGIEVTVEAVAALKSEREA